MSGWRRNCFDPDAVETRDALGNLDLDARRKYWIFAGIGHANRVEIVPEAIARMHRDGEIDPACHALQPDSRTGLIGARPAAGAIIILALQGKRPLADPGLASHGIYLQWCVPDIHIPRTDTAGAL